MIFNHNYTHKSIFFDGGNQRSYVTGGWEAKTETKTISATITSYASIREVIYLRAFADAVRGGVGSMNCGVQARAETIKMIDVTKLSKIFFRVTDLDVVRNNSTTAVHEGGIQVGLCDSDGAVVVRTDISQARPQLDVSGLTGEYRLFVSVDGGYYSVTNPARVFYNYEPSVKISAIWAE